MSVGAVHVPTGVFVWMELMAINAFVLQDLLHKIVPSISMSVNPPHASMEVPVWMETILMFVIVALVRKKFRI